MDRNRVGLNTQAIPIQRIQKFLESLPCKHSQIRIIFKMLAVQKMYISRFASRAKKSRRANGLWFMVYMTISHLKRRTNGCDDGFGSLITLMPREHSLCCQTPASQSLKSDLKHETTHITLRSRQLTQFIEKRLETDCSGPRRNTQERAQ